MPCNKNIHVKEGGEKKQRNNIQALFSFYVMKTVRQQTADFAVDVTVNIFLLSFLEAKSKTNKQTKQKTEFGREISS